MRASRITQFRLRTIGLYAVPKLHICSFRGYATTVVGKNWGTTVLEWMGKESECTVTQIKFQGYTIKIWEIVQLHGRMRAKLNCSMGDN